jgi:hypothetical protein
MRRPFCAVVLFQSQQVSFNETLQEEIRFGLAAPDLRDQAHGPHVGTLFSRCEAKPAETLGDLDGPILIQRHTARMHDGAAKWHEESVEFPKRSREDWSPRKQGGSASAHAPCNRSYPASFSLT